MTTAVRARTARKAHLCEGCHWTPSLRGKPTILPGHRYLLHTAFPGDDVNQGNRPRSMKECVRCAVARESTAGVLEANACSTFCHGETPCARPLRHDGWHSCRDCPADHQSTEEPT
jgi:hypothetical protein